ncbi:phytoene/squalene synthase family protein [Barrientosiimonas marina]|uniref:Phytoene/squalene synthase family protein n=1 Tax=Lentibacillus kimchii TaxID=1542911 RepID=A0ABW2UZ32_9BACI
MNTKQVESDFLYCEAVIKRQSKSFYNAFLELPEAKANAVYAIYAFCRKADDCVDDNDTEHDRRLALQRLRYELDLFAAHEEIDHPLWRALRYVFDHYDMQVQPFYDQLTGQAMDIGFTPPQTLPELEHYSYYVAGSVGLMLLPVLASGSGDGVRQPAIDLGVAMQLTNILRDVGEDFYEKDRIYLPQREMQRFAYTPYQLETGLINQAFVQLWERLAARAEQLYDRFLQQINQFDADSQFPVYLSAQMYRGILDVVRENGHNCLSRRNYVDTQQIAQMTAGMNNCS